MAELHAFVLVFIPRHEWEEMGEDSLYSRIDPYYPHGTEMPPDFDDDDRPLVPHTGMGRVAVILRGGVFDRHLDGRLPSIDASRDPFMPAVAWRALPAGTTCFAIITAERQWVECYEAEPTVLLLEEDGQLLPVNPKRPLTRMQVKWRHYVATHARERPDEVVVPCDAFLRLRQRVDLARADPAATPLARPDAIGS